MFERNYITIIFFRQNVGLTIMRSKWIWKNWYSRKYLFAQVHIQNSRILVRISMNRFRLFGNWPTCRILQFTYINKHIYIFKNTITKNVFKKIQNQCRCRFNQYSLYYVLIKMLPGCFEWWPNFRWYTKNSSLWDPRPKPKVVPFGFLVE